MSRDPYAGSIWDPASLHRYNYGRANPVNYIDPSGRDAIGAAGQIASDVATVVEVAIVGRMVRCYYGAIGAMIAIIAESPFMTKEQAEILSAQIDPVDGCWAKITWQQILGDSLLNLTGEYAIGLAADGIGWLLDDGVEGLNPCELCFAAGTPVHTAHGAVPIEKIKVGDKVWARNERTGATELRRVTAIAPQHFDKLMELRVAGEKSALHPTPTHPFWARRNASEAAHWIDAGDLVAGEQIATQDGRWLTIESVKALDKPAVVYNFTVEEDHDYFVGEQGLLVHNAGETTVFLPFELMPGSYSPSNEYGLYVYPATGYHTSDITALNNASGLVLEDGYVAHHVLYDPDTNLMVGQYVKQTAHAPWHTGGGYDFKQATGIPYDTPEAAQEAARRERLLNLPCE